MNYRYTTVGMGGTFDHFHKGHEHFILFAHELSEKLIIGITKPSLTTHKLFGHLIEPYKERVKAVQSFCDQHAIKADLVPLYDHYGPTIEPTSTVEALAVTTETVSGAQAINSKRQEKKLSKLPVHIFELIPDELGIPITSTRIRAGEVSRNGVVYKTIIERGLTLSQQQRTFFAKTQGPVVNKPKLNAPSYVVGDIALSTFVKNNWNYALGIFDGHTQRQSSLPDQFFEPPRQHQTTNPPGQISNHMVAALKQALTHSQNHLYIEGEEDLCTVALVLLLPLSTYVYYGQPGVGMIELQITEDLKNRFYEALKYH